MREVPLSPAPPQTDPGFLQWVQDSIAALSRGSKIDNTGNQIDAALSGNLSQIQALTDPGADRMLFWDDSAGDFDWLTPGTGLLITSTTITFSFLGIEALTDPNADRIYFWDDSAGSGGASNWLQVDAPLTITTTHLGISSATTGALGVVQKATDAQVYAATADKYMAADHLNTSSAGVAITSSSNVTAVNWTNGINFTETTSEDTKIANPTNGIPGTWRTILVQGNSASVRAITFDTDFLGDVPTITDCTSTKWYLLMIFCVTSSHFVVSSKRAKG